MLYTAVWSIIGLGSCHVASRTENPTSRFCQRTRLIGERRKLYISLLEVPKIRLNICLTLFFLVIFPKSLKIQSVCLSGLILLGFPFCNYVVDIDADGVLLFYPIPQVNPESDGSRLHIMSPLSLGHCTLHLSEWPRENLALAIFRAIAQSSDRRPVMTEMK